MAGARMAGPSETGEVGLAMLLSRVINIFQKRLFANQCGPTMWVILHPANNL